MKTLVLGGIKSGKSRYAETLAKQAKTSIAVIATAQALDTAMAERIIRHQQARPENWLVLEEPLYLARALGSLQDKAALVIVDCLTLWLTNLLEQQNEDLLQKELKAFTRAVGDFKNALILVGNETSMGIIPMGEVTRRYCDEAGLLHQKLAGICDEVVLMAAGIPLVLKGADSLKPWCQA